MKAMVLTGFGGPEKLELRYDHPSPTAGVGEVVVRVAACGVNNTDLWTRTGAYGSAAAPEALAGPRRSAIAFPRVQGADIVGVIDTVGVGVDYARVGERVVVDPVIYSAPDTILTSKFLGSDLDGGYAELVVIPAQNALPVSSGLTDVELATFPVAYGTAMRMLDRVEAATGQRVLVTGATGGVGSALVQLARLRGCDVTAVSRTADFDAELSSLGATSVIRPDAIEAMIGVDLVLDVVAGNQLGPALRTLRRGGTYVIAGAIGGHLVDIDVRTIYLGHLSFLGTSLFAHEQLAGVVAHIESGDLVPLVAATYPLERMAEAQDAFARGGRLGNIVIDVATA